MNNLISRQAAIERLKERRRIFCKNHIEFIILSEKDKARVDEIDNCIATLKNLPSAQPDLDEWCTDCKEYDQEKHCCPRWNRVIRETVEELRRNAQPY